MPDNPNDLRLAVLIDADNASRTAMRDVMAEIAVYGTPTIKRIYGDWTTPNMASWKPILLENAITPIQQYSYTTGKNSTDSAMTVSYTHLDVYKRQVYWVGEILLASCLPLLSVCPCTPIFLVRFPWRRHCWEKGRSWEQSLPL